MEGIIGIFSSLFVILGSPVGVDLADICLDGVPVGNDVLGNFSESSWSDEGLGPGFNLGNIVLDVFAIFQVLW